MRIIDKEVLKEHKQELTDYVEALDERRELDKENILDMLYTLGVLVQHLLEKGEEVKP